MGYMVMSVDNWTREAGVQNGTSLTLSCSSHVQYMYTLAGQHAGVHAGQLGKGDSGSLGHFFACLARLVLC